VPARGGLRRGPVLRHRHGSDATARHRDDPEDRTGFAHLFEHLMFKSSKYLAPEQFDRLTEDVGGSNNASTGNDVTEYHEVVPSNHLERLLWAEAERMQNLKIDEANFQSERAVVEEEYRQRILASPYGRFFNAVDSAPYLQYPYRRPTIGSIADLDAATVADVSSSTPGPTRTSLRSLARRNRCRRATPSSQRGRAIAPSK
jgi:predicted Zn-dependent peptidase